MVKVGDFELPDDLYYTEKHTWARVEGDKVKIGVDAIGLALAGKIIFIRSKKVGKEIKQGKAFGQMESGKGMVALPSPVSGTISEINPKSKEKPPSAMNSDPYGEGWLIVLTPMDLDAELGNLMKGGSDKLKAWAEEEIKSIK